MGRKAPFVTSGSQAAITLTEETSRRKQTKGGGSNRVKSILNVQHLQKLAVWANGEASIPSLGAFFGHCLAACGEAMGIPTDPSLFPCQRCESILQPGYNCTVRIEKNRAKVRHQRKKPNISTQNNVVYKCHFCSHRNLKRRAPKGHMKEICTSKAKPSSETVPANFMLQTSARLEKSVSSKIEVNKMDDVASPVLARDIPITNSPLTPLVGTDTILLEGKRRKRNRSKSNKPAESGINSATIDAKSAVSASNKRRKSWTSLKKIAESSEHNNTRNITNLTIPFFI